MIYQDEDGRYYLTKKRDIFNKMCMLCKKRKATEIHHLIPGRANRMKCDKLGLIMQVCSSCHIEIHTNTGSGLYLRAKQIAQEVFEKQIGTREEFIKIFNKNYL